MLDICGHALQRVFSQLGRVRKDHRNRLAKVAHLVARYDGLRVGANGRVGATERNRRNVAFDVSGGDDRANARHGERLGNIDGTDDAMRNLAAHERGVPLAFARYVVEVFSLAAQEAIILDALDMGADVCVARVSAVMRFHSLSPRLC